ARSDSDDPRRPSDSDPYRPSGPPPEPAHRAELPAAASRAPSSKPRHQRPHPAAAAFSPATEPDFPGPSSVHTLRTGRGLPCVVEAAAIATPLPVRASAGASVARRVRRTRDTGDVVEVPLVAVH